MKTPYIALRNTVILTLLTIGVLLAGCGTMDLRGITTGFSGTVGGNTQPSTEVYQGKYSFVRIQPAESGSAANQAMTVDAGHLRNALAALKGKNNSFAGASLFSSKELDELAPPLAKVIGMMQPGDDVIFAITSAHGVLGLLQSQSVTTGRVFIANGKLNVIFGLARVNFEDELLGNHTLRPFVPGSRTRVIHPDSRLEGAPWKDGMPGRDDWQAIPQELLVLQAREHDGAVLRPPADAPTGKPDSSGISDVERRLEILERLKQRGLITDQEYREKRQAILKDL